MINLRYHIVSIVAVFLALGIGIAMGTAFIDGVIVDRLERNLSDLEAERDQDQELIDSLNARLDSLLAAEEDLASEARSSALVAYLRNVPVVLMAVEGVDNLAVEQVRDTVRGSGAIYGGTYWLTDRLDLADEGAVGELATVLGVDPQPEVVEAELQRAVAAAFRPGPVSVAAGEMGGRSAVMAHTFLEDPADGEVVPASGPDLVFEDLVQMRAFDLDSAGAAATAAVPEWGTRVIFVSSRDADAVEPEVGLAVVDALTDGFGLVAMEVSGEGSGIGIASLIRADDERASAVTTVDHGETFGSQVAAVLALDRVEEVGHYGVGEGATSLLPPPPTA